MANPPAPVTLVAATVATVTLDRDYELVEVLNVDGAAEVSFRFDTSAPTVRGAGCHILPAGVNAVERRPMTRGTTVVKLISAGTPTVSVTGLPE